MTAIRRITVPDWRDWLNTITAVAVRLGVTRQTFHAAVDQCYDDLAALAPRAESIQNVIPLGAGLTQRQSDILQFVYRHYAKHREWPTIRHTQSALNISSTSVTIYNLNVLCDRGLLVHRPGRTPAYITPSGHWAGTIGD